MSAAKDVRALMRQAQSQRAASVVQAAGAATTQKVSSPWVRYNALGHLTCTACFVTLKNEILWVPHAASKKHKDAVAAAQTARAGANASGATSVTPVSSAKPATTAVPAASALTALAGYDDDEDDDHNTNNDGSNEGVPGRLDADDASVQRTEREPGHSAVSQQQAAKVASAVSAVAAAVADSRPPLTVSAPAVVSLPDVTDGDIEDDDYDEGIAKQVRIPHPTIPGLFIVEDEEFIEEILEDGQTIRYDQLDDDDDVDEGALPGPQKRPADVDAEAPSHSVKWARLSVDVQTVRMDSLQHLRTEASLASAESIAAVNSSKAAPIKDQEEPAEEAGALPADFFDKGTVPTAGGKAPVRKSGAAAKVAEADDPDDEEAAAEYERFRRTMQREAVVSVQLQEDDLLEMMQDRDRRLEHEHSVLRGRLLRLRSKKEALTAIAERSRQAVGAGRTVVSSDSDEDMDPEALLDWRAKGF